MTREEINKDKQNEIFKAENKEKTKKIIEKFVKTTIFIIIIGVAFFSYTTYVSTTKISIREYRITNKKIPNEFNGIKILQFSDLHYGTTMFDENLKSIKKIINERKPDLILYTGDLIDKDYKMTTKDTENLTKTLRTLNATIGKYTILGDEDTDKVSGIRSGGSAACKGCHAADADIDRQSECKECKGF